MTIYKIFLFIFFVLILLNLVVSTSSTRKRKIIKDFPFESSSIVTTQDIIPEGNGLPKSSLKFIDSLSTIFMASDTVVEKNFGKKVRADGFSVVENHRNITETAPEKDIFDFDYGNFSDDSFTWHIEKESDWTLSDLEYNQFVTTLTDKFFVKLSSTSEDILDRTKFKFDRNWPSSSSVQQPPPTKLSCIFHVYALKALLSPVNMWPFCRMCTAELIDFTRPVYDSVKNRYGSFLSTALTYHKNFDISKLQALLAYLPKHMINLPDSEGEIPLTTAIRINQLEFVKILIEVGADANYSSGENVKTPFMVAVEIADTDIIEYLLSTGKVDPNIILNDGTNVISLLSYSFPVAFVNYFYKLKNIPIKPSPQLFRVALKQFYSEKNPILKFLIIEISKKKSLPLIDVIMELAHIAVRENDLNFLKFVRSLEISLLLTLPQGINLIHVAASLGHTEIVKFLISSGTEINVTTHGGISAIQVAFLNSHISLVCELIKLGATAGLNEIIKEAICTDNLDIITALLSRKHLNLTNLTFFNGFNPITFAAQLDKIQIVIMMLENGKSFAGIPDSYGRTIFNMNLSSGMKFAIQDHLRNKNL